MKWSDINLHERRWIYKPQKQMDDNKEDIHVPLSEKVISIIKSRASGSKFEFSKQSMSVIATSLE